LGRFSLRPPGSNRAQTTNSSPAQKRKRLGYQARHTNIKAAKAWAGILFARLGLILPNALLTVHLRSTVERESRGNKTAARPLPRKTLAHFSFSTASVSTQASERGGEAAGVVTDWRSGVVACLLAVGSPSQTLMRSDPASADLGKSRVLHFC
jgi:hypothetical protein